MNWAMRSDFQMTETCGTSGDAPPPKGKAIGWFRELLQQNWACPSTVAYLTLSLSGMNWASLVESFLISRHKSVSKHPSTCIINLLSGRQWREGRAVGGPGDGPGLALPSFPEEP